MTDIIQRAKSLLDDTAPGPWKFEDRVEEEYPAGPEWGPMMVELEHFVQDKDGNYLFGNYNDYRMIEAPGTIPLAAAAPELAAALAEETWEYRHEYQVADSQQWYPLTDWAEGEPDRRPWNITPTRIVGRRVSPVEVIE